MVNRVEPVRSLSPELLDLRELSPEPVHIEEIGRRNSDLDALNELKQRKSSVLIPALLKMQKYSSISFTIFGFLHVSSVVVTPVLSVDIADELVMMTRTIYQAPGLEAILVWGSLAVHITSGILLRIIRSYRKHENGQRKSRKTKQRVLYVVDDAEKKLPEEYGLGGITSLLGLGARNSFVSRKLGLTPLSFSGYVLLPVLGFHLLTQRLVPLIVDGDSSFINLSYVSHLLNNQKWLSYLSLISLVWLASYHIISGWMKYLNYYSKKSRVTAYVLINGLLLLSIVSLSQISRLGSSTGFIAKKFNTYMNYLF